MLRLSNSHNITILRHLTDTYILTNRLCAPYSPPKVFNLTRCFSNIYYENDIKLLQSKQVEYVTLVDCVVDCVFYVWSRQLSRILAAYIFFCIYITMKYHRKLYGVCDLKYMMTSQHGFFPMFVKYISYFTGTQDKKNMFIICLKKLDYLRVVTAVDYQEDKFYFYLYHKRAAALAAIETCCQFAATMCIISYCFTLHHQCFWIRNTHFAIIITGISFPIVYFMFEITTWWIDMKKKNENQSAADNNTSFIKLCCAHVSSVFFSKALYIIIIVIALIILYYYEHKLQVYLLG